MQTLALAVLGGLALGCGGDDGASSSSSSASAAGSATATAATGGDDGQGSDSGDSGASGSDAGSESGSGGGSGSATEGGSADNGPDSTAGDAGGESLCDPPTASFSDQASVSIDFAGMGCAVVEGTGTDPQLTFDVRDSGLLDISAVGISIDSASSGTFINDMNVVSVMPDVPITIEAVSVADGTAVTIDVEISGLGPVLIADVSFG